MVGLLENHPFEVGRSRGKVKAFVACGGVRALCRQSNFGSAAPGIKRNSLL